MKQVITIKEINAKDFVISLVEGSGKYYVLYGTTLEGRIRRSEPISDYNIASYYFDLKMKDILTH